MHPIFYYLIFSYLIKAGILLEANSRDALPKLFIWLFSPLFLPIYIGMLLSKHYND